MSRDQPGSAEITRDHPRDQVYARVLDSPDYVALRNMHERPCYMCGNEDECYSKCCKLDMDGVLARHHHPDGEACKWCPSCIGMPAMSFLLKVCNHLEMLKPDPDEPMKPGQRAKQQDFAEMALGAGATTRDNTFLSRGSVDKCGKMRALRGLLSTWRLRSAKVLLFSYSTVMLDILEDSASRAGGGHVRDTSVTCPRHVHRTWSRGRATTTAASTARPPQRSAHAARGASASQSRRISANLGASR